MGTMTPNLPSKASIEIKLNNTLRSASLANCKAHTNGRRQFTRIRGMTLELLQWPEHVTPLDNQCLSGCPHWSQVSILLRWNKKICGVSHNFGLLKSYLSFKPQLKCHLYSEAVPGSLCGSPRCACFSLGPTESPSRSFCAVGGLLLVCWHVSRQPHGVKWAKLGFWWHRPYMGSVTGK